MNFLEQVNSFRSLAEEKSEDINTLSTLIIKLSSLNIEVGHAAATARFKQEETIVRILSQGEKISKTSAESQAIVENYNEYEGLDNLREDIGELVNSIKKRIDVLVMEFKS